MKKEINITIEWCKKHNCHLAKNGAINMQTCTGCFTGTFEDAIIRHRIDNENKLIQLTLNFNFNDEEEEEDERN